MADSSMPYDEFVLAYFIVSDDVDRSRRFYTDVLGGEAVISGEPTYMALANSWIIINVGGGPTDDKPDIILETPGALDRASSFLNIRVADIQRVYDEWSARGAVFLTPPKHHDTEIRCYLPRSGWVPDRGRSNHDRSGLAATSGPTRHELRQPEEGRNRGTLAGIGTRRHRGRACHLQCRRHPRLSAVG